MGIEEDIEKKILELRSELKTDRLDMSFGEIMNLYEKNDLIISPEYQRAYRWNDSQKTGFIESILLGIPIPPIFVAEDKDGVWELVDGLQRVSTILSFFGILKNDIERKNFFKLTSSDLVGDILQDISIKKLSTKLKLTLQRAVCRVEILRWDSSFDMRYELFNRLNTGSSPLKEQEIRNCIFLGSFNNLLKKIAANNDFIQLIEEDETKQQVYRQEMYFEELVLRYFAIIYGDLLISKKGMPNYLTNFMKAVHNSKIILDFDKEKKLLEDIIGFLHHNSNSKLFQGGNNRFSENLYDSIMFLLWKNFPKIQSNPKLFFDACEQIKKDEEYKKLSGYQTHQTYRWQKKIERAEEIFNASF